MPRRSGLGKGLDSLIPVAEYSDADGVGAALLEIPTSAVVPNPHQPRVHFEEEGLVELSASIAAMGVLQPILVRRVDDDVYELIAGERRWRAAKRAGLTTVPAVVRMSDDEGSVEQALVENLHRAPNTGGRLSWLTGLWTQAASDEHKAKQSGMAAGAKHQNGSAVRPFHNLAGDNGTHCGTCGCTEQHE